MELKKKCKEIKGYEGKYIISNYGEIISLPRYKKNKTSDKNVVNVEEDVKVLKDLMKELKLEKQTALHNNEYGEYITECDVLDLYDMQILALQHILAERKQDKKYIKNLELALKNYK